MAIATENADTYEPNARQFLTWSPAMLRTTEREAEEGRFESAALLCDRLLTDDRINGAMGDRVSLLRLPLVVTPANDTAKAKAIAEELQERFFDEIFEASELRLIQTWGLLLGVVPVALDWRDVNGKPRIIDGHNVPRALFRHPRNLAIKDADRRYYLRTGRDGVDTLIDEDSGAWWLYTPYGRSRPWAQGLWNELSLWWLLKAMAQHDWGRKSELHGMGTFVSETEDGAIFEGDARKDLVRKLRRLGREKSIALPSGVTLKLLEAKATSVDIFERQIDLANTSNAIAIVGQNLTTEIKGGSFAAQKGADKVLQRIVDADNSAFAANAKRGPVRYWTIYNYGDASLAPEAGFDTSPPEDSNAKVETWSKLSETLKNLAEAGYSVENLAEATEKLGLKLVRVKPLAPEVGKGDRRNRKAKSDDQALTNLAANPSGDDAFAAGQEYADRVQRSATRVGGKELTSLVDELGEELAKAESFEDVFALVERVYESHDGTQLADITERLYLMCQLAGEYAVSLETDDDDDE